MITHFEISTIIIFVKCCTTCLAMVRCVKIREDFQSKKPR